MMAEEPLAGRPLAGRRAWLITDGKAGHEAQAAGVAEALGVAVEWRRVAPRGIAKVMAPWGPADPSFECAPPWPALVIGIGRTAMPALRLVRRKAGAGTFTVALQDPRTSASIADLIWVPEHDRRRGGNVISTLTPPNRFSAEVLANLRAELPQDIAMLPSPRVMLSIGGTAKVWKFTPQDATGLAAAITAFGGQGASLLATTSRRTPAYLAGAVAAALAPFPHILWTGDGENPYAKFLAHADAIVVTADSVSMAGEACTTGRPVYVFKPTGGSAKFQRFHETLVAKGATRPLLPDTILDLGWHPQPLRSAALIAREIEARWQKRARFLTGLMQGS